jgi:hypothetical protein
MNSRQMLKVLCFVAMLVFLDWSAHEVLTVAFKRAEVGDTTGGAVNKIRKARANVVILGSSRARRHYDTTILSEKLGLSVRNAGCDGQGMPYVCGIADLLLQDYKPKLFVINIDERSLVMLPAHYDRIAVLSPFIDESPVIREMIYHRGVFEPLKYLSRSFRYNGKVLGIAKGLFARDTTIKGYAPLDRCFDPARAQAVVEADSCNDPLLTRLLVNAIEAARSAGAEVVLSTGPRWFPDFKLPAERKRLLQEIVVLSEKNEVPYVVITVEDTPVFRDPALYADPSHLNRLGAEIYSNMLADRLIELSRVGRLRVNFVGADAGR